jgi:transcriptional regulator GlxA family with amidase domain
MLGQLTAQFTGVGTGDRQAILHTSLALLHLLLIRPEIRWQETLLPEGLLRAYRRIETDYAAPLHLAELARIAGLGPRSFARLFIHWRGVSPTRFLGQVRVREAARLLANTHHSLDEIAERTGFPDRYYMSRVFKRIIGDSPAHFRKRHSPSAR